jgi:streptogramin lyase
MGGAGGAPDAGVDGTGGAGGSGAGGSGAGGSGASGSGGADAGTDQRPDGPRSAMLSGTTSYDFGIVLVGARTASVPWVVTNNGDMDTGPLQLTNTAPAVVSATNGCMGTLGPGASCTIQVAIAPTIPSGGRQNYGLTLTASPGGTVSFTAPTDARTLAVDPAPSMVNLGNVLVGSTMDLTFTVSNPAAQTSSGLSISINPQYGTGFTILDPVVGDCNGTALASGASCTIRVRFTAFASTDTAATLTVYAPQGGTVSKDLSARGIRPATLSGATRHNFGTSAAGTNSAAFTWTISNPGDVATGALTLSNGNATELLVGANTCMGSLAASDICAISVVFRPSANTARSGTLALSGTPGGTLTLTATANDLATGTVTLFPINTAVGADPTDIAAGPDGNVWFTEHDGMGIGRLTPNGGLREFALPDMPQSITLGPDGNLWYVGSAAAGASFVPVTPVGSVMAPVVAEGVTELTAITPGPFGLVWGAGLTIGNMGAICNAAAAGSAESVANQFYISGHPSGGIAYASDGGLWYTDADDLIGRMSTSGTVTLQIPTLTANSSPAAITVGPDGDLWFVERTANNIGHVSIIGTMTEYPVPTPNAGLIDITAGPDGNLWFTEQNKIGRITPQGAITEFPGSGRSITAGPDGNLWFTAPGNIGRVTP